MRVSREGRRTRLQAEDTGQWRQVSHSAWRPRGGRALLPVGTVAGQKLRFSYNLCRLTAQVRDDKSPNP